MRRRLVHCAFGATAVVCAALAAYQGLRLQHSNRVNAAIAGARVSDFDASVPEARFARALTLARAGESEAALKAYKTLIQGGRRDLRLRSLYNLGNLHLRNALANGADEAFRSLPLIELAKRSYRDLLRDDPFDWDARYNLERALWLAPEADHEVAADEEPPEKEENVMSTLQGARIDLP